MENIVVSSTTNSGQLVSVDLRISTSIEEEAYRMLIKSDKPKCDSCGEDLEPEKSTMAIRIDNPLQSGFGLDLGTPVCVCPKCGTKNIFPNIVDVSSFPTIAQYLQALRNAYNKKKAEAARRRSNG